MAIAAWLRGATLVNWLQDLFPEVGVRLGVAGLVNVQSLLVALRDRSLHAASLNVVLGERMRDALIARGIPAARILVLPNWAEKNLHPVAREQNALRDQWGYSADEFVVGYSGNMGRAHDIESIIAAAVRLREHMRIRFLFIGDGAKRRLVEQTIVANDLHNVLVKGYQDQCTLSQSLSLPDVHLVSLLPELEGLIVPSKLYGALAVGRAVINIGDTDGEVARVLHASAAGHSCASGDVQRLCELLQDVSEGDACADAGANGLRYARANLHRDIALQRWHRALAMLDIHRGGHPGRVLVGVGAAAGNGSPQLTSSMPQ